VSSNDILAGAEMYFIMNGIGGSTLLWASPLYYETFPNVAEKGRAALLTKFHEEEDDDCYNASGVI